MSKRHQASRRRTYGRRQHEIHERREHGWQDLAVEARADEAGGVRGEAGVVEYRTQAYGATWVGLE